MTIGIGAELDAVRWKQEDTQDPIETMTETTE